MGVSSHSHTNVIISRTMAQWEDDGGAVTSNDTVLLTVSYISPPTERKKDNGNLESQEGQV